MSLERKIMANNRTMISLWIILISLGHRVRTLESNGCSLKTADPHAVWIICPADAEDNYKLKIHRDDQWIRVYCNGMLEWSDAKWSGSLPKVRKLDSVYVENCPMPDDSFDEMVKKLGVTSTRVFSVDSRSAPSARHLSRLRGLAELIIQGCEMDELGSDLLQDLSHLTSFTLRETAVEVLPGDLFRNTLQLSYIYLGYNGFQQIDSLLFRNLSLLNILYLTENALKVLNPGTFDDLIALTYLNLEGNQLKMLPASIFSRLKNLEELIVSDNEFSSLPKKLVAMNSGLKIFTMIDNRGQLNSLPEGLLSNLNSLTEVNLENNNFTTLPENIFWGCGNLTSIDLTNNSLTEIPINIFKDSVRLLYLQLASNKINILRDGLFEHQSELLELNLRENRLTTISQWIFANLTSLDELYLTSNRISHLHPESFRYLRSLRDARLSRNLINMSREEFGDFSPFVNCKSLEQLYLDHNKITTFFDDWPLELPILSEIDLGYNQITSLPLFRTLTSEDRERSVTISVVYNRITKIPESFSESYPSDSLSIRSGINLFIEGNPIDCGCVVHHLLKHFETKTYRYLQRDYNIIPENSKCSKPPMLKDKLLTKINSTNFVCRKQSLSSNSNCPRYCDCSWRPSNSTLLIDCSGKNMSRIPDDFVKFHGDSVEMNLSDNRLSNISLSDKRGYEKIRVLILSRNNISSISPKDLTQNMEVLLLDNNNLTKIQAPALEAIEKSTSLQRVDLSDNPWNCDRRTRDSFRSIERKFETIVTHASNCQCIDKRPRTKESNATRLYIIYTVF